MLHAHTHVKTTYCSATPSLFRSGHMLFQTPLQKASGLPRKGTLFLRLKRSERTDLNMPTVWYSTAHRICSRERTLEGAARAIIDPSKGRRMASVVFGPAHHTSGKNQRYE